jgi:3-deoxy-D-manno-octulosonic acid kinase
MSAAVTTSESTPPFTPLVRGPYAISSRGLLSDEQATKVVQELLSDVDSPSPGVLGGRGKTRLIDVPGLGKVFLKRYSHGGMLRKLTAGHFLCLGQLRSKVEFEMLELVRSLGLNAPEPIAFVQKGSTIYSTWLLMEELRDTRSIVEIGENEGDALPRALDGLSEQIRILIKHRIFHVDLHPGNVLVGKADKIYIVDFDKACYFKGTQHALRELYLRRWRRAVIKHKLSPLLSEMMSLTLRSYDE